MIVDHMNINKLCTECQHGFRKHQSCITQLFEVMKGFTLMFDNRETIDVVYLDYKKAFDSVPHERLLTKLGAYGVTGSILKWIRPFLERRLKSQSWKIFLRSFSSFKRNPTGTNFRPNFLYNFHK